MQSIGPRDLFAAVSQGANGAELGIAITAFIDSPRILYVNETLLALGGYTAEEVSTQSAWRFFASEDLDRLQCIYQAHLRGEPVPRSIQTQLRHKSGRTIPIDLSSTLVTVNGLHANVSFVTDLTDRKRAEEELRSSEARFRQLVDSAPDGVVILRQARIVFANAAAARLLGAADPALLLGADVGEALEPQSAELLTRRLDDLLAGEQGPFEPQEYKTRGGRIAEVSSILLDYEGQPAVLGFARDVTERKAMHERLVQADRLAAVGMLAAGVAHEVNNPLAYVLLNLKYLERELPKLARDPSRLDTLMRHVADASHGAERVQTIVRDLRTFARTDKDSAGPVDLTEVVDSALAMAEHEIRQKAQLVKKYAPVPAVNGTVAKLEQVMLNLIVNAAQALEPGHAAKHRIEVSIENASATTVRVTVSDTGPGMPSEVAARAFEPFFTTKPPGLGTGLGLSICRSIVETFGGSIWLEAGPGGGTRVYVELLARPGEHPPSLGPSRTSDFVPSPGTRLLIVDDETSVSQMLSRFLQNYYQIRTCDSGEAALGLLRAGEQFDLILCDVMMPRMSGIELFEAISKECPGTAERVVFMTGGALLPEVATFLKRVHRPKIEKPFDLNELQRTLGRLLPPQAPSPEQ